MKFLGIIIFGVLFQLALLEPAAVAHHTQDTFSSVQHHFEMVSQSESWGAVSNLNDSENLKKIHRSGFSVFGGKFSIPAQICATGYSSRTKKVVRPLRYQLCVLRL